MFKNALKLIQFIRPFKWEVVFVFVSGFVLGIVSTFPTFLAGILTNALEKKSLASKLPDWALTWLHNQFGQELVSRLVVDHGFQLRVIAISFPIVFLILGTVRYVNHFNGRYVAEKISNELRFELLNRLVGLNHQFFLNLQAGSGSLLSRTLNDTLVIQQGLNLYTDLIREPFVAVISLGLMLWVNFKLTVICLICSPIVIFVTQTVSRRLRKLAGESQENLDVLTKIFKESIDGIRVIHAYNLENYVRARFRQKVDQYNSVRKKVSKRMEVASPINEFVVSFVVGGLCWYVGKLILKGESDLSSFITFIFLAANLQNPFKKIQQAIVGIQNTEVSIQRVMQVIESQDVITEKPNHLLKEFPTNWESIEFKNVCFSYGSKQVLHNINLTIKRGQTVALVGESGGGKSTMVNLLMRFFDPTEGAILVDGVDLREFSLKRLRNEMAYVSQDTFIFDETIEENIRFGNKEKSHEEMVEAAQKANALPFIQDKPEGFQTRAGERGAHLSGGQKQRLSIARALFKDAPILILDEATSALDSASEAEVQKGISSLLLNRTSLVIAHRLSTIRSSHMIVVLEKGHIVEMGRHNDLIQLDNYYARYYKLQEISSQTTN